MTKKTILFFSPYSLVNVFNYPEAVVAESLRRRGHDIVHVRCRGLYADYCIAMAAIGLTPRSPAETKAASCLDCNERRKALEAQFAFRTIYLEDYATAAAESRIADSIASVDPINWATFEVDAIPVGRYASYEYILNEKINTKTFPPDLWDGYIIHLKNALRTLEAGRRIFDDVRPDAVLAYNTNYSCNHVMCALADQRGVPHYSEHLGSHHKYMYSEMTIFRGHLAYALLNRSSAWERMRGRPLTEAQVDRASEHVVELLEARSPWVYTVKSDGRSPDAVRAFFGIGPDQKVLLVTMASGDERFAADLIDALPKYQEPIFPTQVAWIKALTTWIEKRPDLALIIRVHPREFPNKRENVLSKYARHLRDVLVDLPANCRVNWPEDSISLHDLVGVTDVGLNATSTAGLELLLFGVPVVVYDAEQLFSYPREINLCATSEDDYWQRIETALQDARSLDNIIRAFRWISFKSTIAAIDIGDVYGRHFEKPAPDPEPAPTKTSLLRRLREAIWRRPPAAEAIRDLYRDPFMNFDALGHAKNADWLVYAVENAADSHLDTLSERVASTEAPDADLERAAVAVAARRYFSSVGMSQSLLDLQNGRSSQP